jgi:hypothetical protein
VPRDITIHVSRLSPFQVEAQFFAVLAEPVDVRARKNLIEAWYRLSEPQLLHLGSEGANKRDAKLHKRAVRVIEQERLLAAECALAYIFDRIAKENGRDGINLQANDAPLGPLTMENVGLWALREQRWLRGRSDDRDKVTGKNFQQQAWRNSKPVLHLAVVTHLWTRNMAPEMKVVGAGALSEVFGDPVATRILFGNAEMYRGMLLKIARGGAFKLEENETVRLVAV